MKRKGRGRWVWVGRGQRRRRHFVRLSGREEDEAEKLLHRAPSREANSGPLTAPRGPGGLSRRDGTLRAAGPGGSRLGPARGAAPGVQAGDAGRRRGREERYVRRRRAGLGLEGFAPAELPATRSPKAPLVGSLPLLKVLGGHLSPLLAFLAFRKRARGGEGLGRALRA